MINSKKCRKCGLEKSAHAFHKHKETKDGLNSWCSDCVRLRSKTYFDQLGSRRWADIKVPKTKKCTVCDQIKNAKEFTRSKHDIEGLARSCRECTNRIRNKSRAKNPIRTAWNQFRWTLNSARSSQDSTDISSSTFSVILTQPCHYCGDKHDPIKNIGSYWLDRVDNTRGYYLDNVLPCCGTCNKTRGNRYTVEEAEVMISSLLEYRKQQSEKLSGRKDVGNTDTAFAQQDSSWSCRSNRGDFIHLFKGSFKRQGYRTL